MKFIPFIVYAIEKAKLLNHELQRDIYALDCLWALAAEMRFNIDGKPTIQRFSELISPNQEIPEAKITKEDMKSKFRRLKNDSGGR